MKTIASCFAPAVVGLLLIPLSQANAQEPAKPGPEHELLKKMEGNWDTTMKFLGMESKGAVVYKMELGGLWLSSTFEGEVAGRNSPARDTTPSTPRRRNMWAFGSTRCPPRPW